MSLVDFSLASDARGLVLASSEKASGQDDTGQCWYGCLEALDG